MEWDGNGIDADNNERHEQYMGEFRQTISGMIRNAIDQSLSNDPDGGKQRKKTVQVIDLYFFCICIVVRSLGSKT